ncbi:hypothetical protein NEMIN01_2217, partial [Nematocida minor]
MTEQAPRRKKSVWRIIFEVIMFIVVLFCIYVFYKSKYDTYNLYSSAYVRTTPSYTAAEAEATKKRVLNYLNTMYGNGATDTYNPHKDRPTARDTSAYTPTYSPTYTPVYTATSAYTPTYGDSDAHSSQEETPVIENSRTETPATMVNEGDRLYWSSVFPSWPAIEFIQNNGAAEGLQAQPNTPPPPYSTLPP